MIKFGMTKYRKGPQRSITKTAKDRKTPQGSVTKDFKVKGPQRTAKDFKPGCNFFQTLSLQSEIVCIRLPIVTDESRSLEYTGVGLHDCVLVDFFTVVVSIISVTYAHQTQI